MTLEIFEYQVNAIPSLEDFINLLNRSGLAARRPVDDHDCLQGMLDNSNLLVTAWDGDELTGIARAMTDFHYACYLSDLAVDKEYQKIGIGKKLQVLVQQQLGPKCKLILIAAPDADSYYKHLGFSKVERCWLIERDHKL